VGVEVHHVETGLTGLELAQDGVHVRAIHVGQRTSGVDRLEHLADPFLEQAQRRWVGEHDRRRARAERRLERGEVDLALRIGRNGHRLEAGHRRGRRVGAV
jgi:hypothetical protein